MAIQHVGIYCGSREGSRPAYKAGAAALGAALARHGMGIVYGGAAHGLMGAIADAVLAGGQRVIGVIPRGLARAEFAHPRLSTAHVVDTMHERKALMEKEADAFVALPGGFGTMDELFEILTWAQIGLHEKPIGLLNVEGYWDPMVAQVKRGLEEGFIPPVLATVLVVENSADALVERLLKHSPPPSAVKWIR
jgi:uncharacterized protein (TIGR00730 family)